MMLAKLRIAQEYTKTLPGSFHLIAFVKEQNNFSFFTFLTGICQPSSMSKSLLVQQSL